MQAKANFKVTKWDQTAISDVGAGPEWGRATVLKTFEGDLEGESRAELLLAGAPEGGAGYIAQKRFIGRLGDRTGTFDTGAGGPSTAAARCSTAAHRISLAMSSPTPARCSTATTRPARGYAGL